MLYGSYVTGPVCRHMMQLQQMWFAALCPQLGEYHENLMYYLSITDAGSGASVGLVEPQSHGGSATDPTGSADSGCRGSLPLTRVSAGYFHLKLVSPTEIFTNTCLSCSAGLGPSGASFNAAPQRDADAALNSQSGCSPQVATATEQQQQQQFVHQLLQALADTDNQVTPCFLLNFVVVLIEGVTLSCGGVSGLLSTETSATCIPSFVL